MERDKLINGIELYESFCVEEIVKYFLTINNYSPIFETYNGLEFLYNDKRIIIKDFLKESDINSIFKIKFNDIKSDDWIIFLDSRQYKDKYFKCYLLQSFNNDLFNINTIDELFNVIKENAIVLYDGTL